MAAGSLPEPPGGWRTAETRSIITRSGSSTRMTRTAEEGNMMAWSTAAPAISAAFPASLVEVVEAFTIVLAVATLRGWRPAAPGTAAGLGVLAGIVLLVGALLDRGSIT